MRLRPIFALTLLVVWIAPSTSSCEPTQPRQSAPTQVARQPAPANEPPPFDATQSAGLFVGVRLYPFEEALAEVPYAVDDAVDLAHRFSLGSEGRLIPPERVVLALSGEPKKPASERRLEALLRAGARRTEAFPKDIEAWLEEQAKIAGEAGLLVVSFATHGVKHRAHEYLLTTAYLERDIPNTSVLVNTVLREVGKSRSWRRLILLDACREIVKPGNRSPVRRTSINPRAPHETEGQVVLSARPNAALYDDPRRGQGVFTAAVLDALACPEALATDHVVTLEELANFVNDQMLAWERRRPALPDARSRGGISRQIEGSLGRFPLVHCP